MLPFLLCKICHGAWTKSNYLIMFDKYFLHIGEVPRPYGDQGQNKKGKTKCLHRGILKTGALHKE